MCIALRIGLLPVRLLFCISTKLYLVLGVIFLIIGPYIWYSSSTYLTTIKDSYYTASVIPKALACLGAVLIAIGVLGHCGITIGSKIFLNAYVLLSLSILILQIVLGMVTMKQFESIETGLEKMNDALRASILLYDQSEEMKHAMDYLQENLKCCGAENKGDWEKPPKSCCVIRSSCESFHPNGCGKLLFEYIQGKMELISGFAYGTTIFQVFGIIAAYLFITTG